MCRTCDGYQLKLKLRRSELLCALVMRTARIEELCDAIDQLEVDYLVHRNHCRWWQDCPQLQPVAMFVGRN